jgi:hypothetical protein
MPQFTRLARTAAIALGAAILVALGGYALETRRLARRVGQARPVVPRVISRTASTLAQRVWVRDPLERATFFFVLQTCVRGATQRLYLAAGVAVTLAMLVAVVPAPELRALLRPSPEPTLPLMTVQMFVICAASATLRLVCAAPTDLRANWIFRVTWAREPGKCFSGVRRAALAGIAVPLSILVLVDVRAWGLPFALVHLVFAALAAVAVVEWSFLDLRALPFTSAGGGRKAALIWRAASTLAISWPLGWLEYWGTRSPSQASIAVGALAMTAIGLAAFRARRLRAIEDVAFDEAPDLPTQRLGLGVE